ncbi:MAG TPA: ATP-binding protein [Gemmatimonadales bacterium]|nr:ATP-binding protein [Gemmatimonadales bacterium]
MTSDSGALVGSPDPSLALLGTVARIFNGGLGFEAAVTAVVRALREGLPAQRVTLWLRDPGTAAFHAVASPVGNQPPVAEVERLPAPRAHTARVALRQEAESVGLLEVEFGAPRSDQAILDVLADFLAPFVASATLSADLAQEVAVRSREIDEQRRFISLIIDSLPVGLYVVDREYRIQAWNRKRETGTQGLRRDDVVGRPVFEVLSRQPRNALRATFDRVFDTGTISEEDLEVDVGGDHHIYRITRIPMRLEGDAITHVITVGEDVTDARVTQRRILQSEKLAAIGHLAAGVMHEINNPLATIGACVAAMEGRLAELSGPALDAVREYLQIVDKEVERCTGIVNGLLDFSRPKGKAKQTVQLNAVVEDALFLLKHHKAFAQLVVTRELDPNLPPTAANPEQLIQVLMALMLNALDAMEGGGHLTLRSGRSRMRPDELHIEVADSGAGIPRPHLSQIFEPFFTTKPPGRGTGLGLSISYGIVQEHKGRIEVESEPGHGSLFRVVLPATERPE